MTLVAEVIESGEEVLILADGVVWQGQIVACPHGVLDTLVVRAGALEERSQQVFRLADVEVERMDAPATTATDPLVQQSRDMVNAAREYGAMTLAERIIRDRMLRGR